MDNYIKAGDFFNLLFKNNIADPFIWQDASCDTSYYNVTFSCNVCTPLSFHSVVIFVIAGDHYIRRTSANFLLNRHNLAA